MSGRSRTTLKVSAQQEKALETFVFENVEKSENLTKKDKKHCASTCIFEVVLRKAHLTLSRINIIIRHFLNGIRYVIRFIIFQKSIKDRVTCAKKLQKKT